jgi:hypothetical protein
MQKNSCTKGPSRNELIILVRMYVCMYVCFVNDEVVCMYVSEMMEQFVFFS